MEFTAEMIAGLLQGEVVGNKNAKVHTVSSIEGGTEGALTYLTNPQYEKYIYTTGASIVLVSKDFKPSAEIAATLIKIEVGIKVGFCHVLAGVAERTFTQFVHISHCCCGVSSLSASGNGFTIH